MRPLNLILGRSISPARFALAVSFVFLAAAPSQVIAEGPTVCITEVLSVPTTLTLGSQKVELTNISAAPVDVSGWRFWMDSNFRDIPQGTVLLPDERFIVHISGTGSGDGNNLYTGASFPPVNFNTGSVALWAPGANFTNPDDMIDFMQWGPGPNLPGSQLAHQAGLWSGDGGSVTPAVQPGVSMQWCSKFQVGATAWDQDAENVGEYNPCALNSLPVDSVTWGRVKTLFKD